MSKKKILCVDDSETILYFEKMVLAATYDLIAAKNGRLGFEAALAQKPDLVLMDLMMPEMDGIEALKAIKEHEEIKHIPVIMVTTKSEKDRVEACYKLGCSDYVSKPINKIELLTKVKKYIG